MFVYDLIDNPKGYRGPRFGITYKEAVEAVGGSEALDVALRAAHVEERYV
jgi:hypothetical protein